MSGDPEASLPTPSLRLRFRVLLEQGLVALNRLRLPGASVLPVAGAVVGLYAGLAAGVFTNLIGLVSGGVFGWPQVISVVRPGSETRHALSLALLHARWLSLIHI